MEARYPGRPPETQRALAHKIIIVDGKKPLKGIVVTDEIHLGVTTHWSGATVPCQAMFGRECKLCDAGVSTRWYAYLAVMELRTSRQEVLRFAGGSAVYFEDFIRAWGTLRGACLTAERAIKGKTQAKLKCTLTMGSTPANTLPKPLDAFQIVMHMWGLDRDPEFLAEQAKLSRLCRVAELEKLRIEGRLLREDAAEEEIEEGDEPDDPADVDPSDLEASGELFETEARVQLGRELAEARKPR